MEFSFIETWSSRGLSLPDLVVWGAISFAVMLIFCGLWSVYTSFTLKYSKSNRKDYQIEKMYLNVKFSSIAKCFDCSGFIISFGYDRAVMVVYNQTQIQKGDIIFLSFGLPEMSGFISNDVKAKIVKLRPILNTSDSWFLYLKFINLKNPKIFMEQLATRFE